MGLNTTPQEKEQFNALNRLRMKSWRDRKRQRKYAPRGKYRDIGCVQIHKEEKQ